METDEIMILALAVVVFLKFAIYDPIMNYWHNGQTVTEKLIVILSSLEFQISSAIIVAILIIIFLIRLRILRARKETGRLRNAEERSREENLVKTLIHIDIEDYGSEKLEKFIIRLEDIEISEEVREEYSYKIRKKLAHTVNLLEKELHDEELYRYQVRRNELREETKKLKQENYDAMRKHEKKTELLLEKLNIEDNFIYEKDNLREEEIEILKENDFEETNEYDPIENKHLTFFVKKILNHSATHSFLVERIKQLLGRYLQHHKIRRHDTKDADLTFQVNHKIYALEIETGSSFSNKRKLEGKVSLLNNKYGQNWYIIVSNRDLAKKYREYGKITSRKGVCKIIEKLVQN